MLQLTLLQGDEQLSIPHLKLRDVIHKMWNARTKWYFIGIQFNIADSDLDAIEADSKDVDEKLRKMIESWLKTGENCNWEAVDDALKNPTVAAEPATGLFACFT